MISAKVVADSKNKFGDRLTTMVVTFPRYILAELNTHRMLSRNSASSRAIPFKKMVESVDNNPFVPIAWQRDHKGMQGTEYHELVEMHRGCWLDARDKAVKNALFLSEHDVTKQLCNRLLEPFMWHTVIISGTEWENFFYLRCPKYKLLISEEGYRSRKDLLKANPQLGFTDPNTKPWVDWLLMNEGQADIHMMALAEAMWDAYNESTPKRLAVGEWHIPFGDNMDNNQLMSLYASVDGKTIEKGVRWNDTEIFDSNKAIDYKVKVATARCARVSYTVVGEEDKPDNYEADIKLHDRLASMGHWSPFEHCAQAQGSNKNGTLRDWSGNFYGFSQYRKMFDTENVTKLNS